MPTNIRQQIMTAIDTAFQAIQVTNGYETDIGLKVFEWKSTAVAQADTPCLIWRDTECALSTENVAIGQQEHMLTVEAQIIPAPGVTTPVEARKMVADILKAIGVDESWGGLAQHTYNVSNDFEVEQKERILGSILITFQVEFRTARWSAYA